MKKMKRYEDGGDVDYDKDSDPEAQKVYRRDLSEVTRAPAAKPAAKKMLAKKAAPKRGTPGHKDYFSPLDPDMSVKGVRDDDGSYDRKEQRRAMMSGFGVPSRSTKVDDSREFRRLPEAANKRAVGDAAGEFSYKKGGSVGSASRRADGIAQRGKTRGRVI